MKWIGINLQVRTERVNPHVLSVRINEGVTVEGQDRKHLAYLLDRQTIAVVDLVTGNFLMLLIIGNYTPHLFIYLQPAPPPPSSSAPPLSPWQPVTRIITAATYYNNYYHHDHGYTITTITTTLTTTSSSQPSHQMSLPLVMCEHFAGCPSLYKHYRAISKA